MTNLLPVVKGIRGGQGHILNRKTTIRRHAVRGWKRAGKHQGCFGMPGTSVVEDAAKRGKHLENKALCLAGCVQWNLYHH